MRVLYQRGVLSLKRAASILYSLNNAYTMETVVKLAEFVGAHVSRI